MTIHGCTVGVSKSYVSRTYAIFHPAKIVRARIPRTSAVKFALELHGPRTIKVDLARRHKGRCSVKPQEQGKQFARFLDRMLYSNVIVLHTFFL